MSVIWSQFCIEKSRWEREFCPLSGIEKRPPHVTVADLEILGGGSSARSARVKFEATPTIHMATPILGRCEAFFRGATTIRAKGKLIAG